MYKQITAFAVLTLAAVCYAQVSGWTNCGSPQADVNDVRIRGCNQVPCVFTRGTPYYIEVHATARNSSNTLNFETFMTFLFQRIVLLSGDVCDVDGVECPVNDGDNVIFLEEVNLPLITPTLTVTTNTHVWDHNGNIAICVQFPVQVA